MLRGIYRNSSAMQIMQDKINVVSNNLANVSTAGYKKKGVFCQQLMDAEQALERNQLDVKLSKERIATYTDESGGAIRTTNNPLDFAISSKGFFQIQTPQGIGYTRNGEFNINSNGDLVNTAGMPVLGEGGPINIQGNHIEVNKEGSVIVDGLLVNRFALKNIDVDNSKSIGNNIFLPKNAADVTVSTSQIEQGSLEMSNVNVVNEMVNMIVTQRNYDFNAKVIKTQDSTLNRTVNDIAK